MAEQHVWDNRWEFIKRLRGGGQGHTILVRDTHGGPDAVVKWLKNQESNRARRRIAQEVRNLEILYAAGAKVPRVLDGNTEKFDDPSTELFFVMEYIEGDGLAKIINDRGGLPIESAVAVTRELCQTVRFGISERIQHRDIKPDNIIVRSLEPPDVVVVDYGLSFNEAEDTGISKPGETIGGAFLTLPERHMPGGDRHDPRSDLTLLCGVLYYCVVGKPPTMLQGPEGRPPHRRKGAAVREKMGDDARTNALESFLDRGFATSIDSRFQTLDELEQRIAGVLNPTPATPRGSIIEISQEIAERVLRSDRPSQLAKYKENAEQLRRILGQVASEIGTQIAGFTLHTDRHGVDVSPLDNPEETQVIGVKPSRLDLVHTIRSIVRSVAYGFFARGNECGIFRAKFKGHVTNPRSGTLKVEVTEPWVCIHWYDGLMVPEPSILKDDVKAAVIDAMDEIEREIMARL